MLETEPRTKRESQGGSREEGRMRVERSREREREREREGARKKVQSPTAFADYAMRYGHIDFDHYHRA